MSSTGDHKIIQLSYTSVATDGSEDSVRDSPKLGEEAAEVH